MQPHAAPFNPDDRHLLIDALRGLALAGVLLANLGYLSLYELMTEADRLAMPSAAFDSIGVTLMEWLINGKAITVFSLLFGLGFAVQIERAGGRGDNGLPRFLRRLLWLLVIGLIHSYLLWWGDILAIYAVVGLLLVLFRRAPDSVLLVGGISIATVLPSLMQIGPNLLDIGITRAQINANSLAAFLSSDWQQIFNANALMANWVHVTNGTLLCFVLGRFLIGYWAGRRGLLQHPHRHRALLWRMLWITAICAVFSPLLVELVNTLPQSDVVRVVRGTLSRLGTLMMGCAYACAFALLFLRPLVARGLSLLAPMGRMALTLYLMQSAIGILLFYGAGLGIGPWQGVAGWWLAWLGIFAAQLVFSHWWLAHFRYGPCEWVWRSLTYGAWQPMRPTRGEDAMPHAH